jgi:hypothetical protein
MITLYLASLAGNMIKAGLIDTRGEFLKMPLPVNEQPQDPRLAAPDPVQTLGSAAPARTGGGGRTAVQAATDVLALSDAEFDAIPPEKLEAMLKELGA